MSRARLGFCRRCLNPPCEALHSGQAGGPAIQGLRVEKENAVKEDLLIGLRVFALMLVVLAV